jgi:hypothetical protein
MGLIVDDTWYSTENPYPTQTSVKLLSCDTKNQSCQCSLQLLMTVYPVKISTSFKKEHGINIKFHYKFEYVKMLKICFWNDAIGRDCYLLLMT